VLAEAYVQATAIREANVLWSGRVSKSADVLPHERRTLAGVGRLLGYGPGSHDQLVEDHLRAARRARAVFERVFYG
jgi:glutamate-ammonia-ligase adenylyltransferase